MYNITLLDIISIPIDSELIHIVMQIYNMNCNCTRPVMENFPVPKQEFLRVKCRCRSGREAPS